MKKKNAPLSVVTEFSLAENQRKKLDTYLIPFLNTQSKLTVDDIQLLWDELASFPLPNLVLERVPLMWNHVLIRKDKRSAGEFIRLLKQFISTKQLGKSAHSTLLDLESSYDDYFN